MAYEIEEGEVFRCTVERISNTTTFVKVHAPGGDREGSIVISEIAPGRIKNLREYVVPKKTIICKVLRISPTGNLELSLRRVTKKEQKEVLDEFKQEKSYKAIFKTVLGEKAKEILNKISQDFSTYEFVQEIKEDSKKLEKFVSKKDAEKILEILISQKTKKSEIKKIFKLSSTEPAGISDIKEILTKIKEAEVHYISAGKYSIKTEADDLKKADNKLKEILEKIEQQAKKKKITFSIGEK